VAATSTAVPAEQAPVVGSIPLTPIQAWFFARGGPDPSHFNQSFLLAVSRDLDPALLPAVLGQLVAHHDALRMRYEPGDDGVRQIGEPPGAEAPWLRIDLEALPPLQQSAALTQAAAAVQASLDLSRGTLVRAALFGLGGEGLRLLIAVHHLAVDAVSWRILLEDLQTACRALAAGRPVQLPLKTTSFKEWAERLLAFTRAGGFDDELESWLSAGRTGGAPLPVDLAGGVNSVASRRSVAVSLAAEETGALLREVLPVYRIEVQDALVWALATACARWSGSGAFLLDLEGHGREPLFPDVDLSRTVGWFTSLFPVLVELPSAGCDPGAAVVAVRDRLRSIPRQGLGYGALRYLADRPEVREGLAALPGAEVVFVYLGQIHPGTEGEALLVPAAEPAGSEQSPRVARSHLLDVTAVVARGRLEVTWGYSASLHRAATVEALASAFTTALRDLMRHCREREEGRYSPSHFPQAALNREELDDLVASLEMPQD
ncbi:MAG TPA: condensation domain-containing protein, partial [Thermoanaerobaculia bacterium]|nr:condensation domain-containing protein [Thermoanaerobaculia bacterium]